MGTTKFAFHRWSGISCRLHETHDIDRKESQGAHIGSMDIESKIIVPEREYRKVCYSIKHSSSQMLNLNVTPAFGQLCLNICVSLMQRIVQQCDFFIRLNMYLIFITTFSFFNFFLFFNFFR